MVAQTLRRVELFIHLIPPHRVSHQGVIALIRSEEMLSFDVYLFLQRHAKTQEIRIQEEFDRHGPN